MVGKTAPTIGSKLSAEHRKKLSDSHKGQVAWNKGMSGLSNEGSFKEGHRPPKGEKSPMWKGGRTISRGYILIYKPSHPFCNKQGYILEHRLVMEKFLKRYLTSEEVVHHINGIKDDNRLNNLMLFHNNSLHHKYHRMLKHLNT